MGHKIKTRKHPRHGTQCVIQYPTNRNPAQSLQDNAITVFRPRLYNSLSKYLRDIESIKTEKFIFDLDMFLELIPDQPKMPDYITASGSNSILGQLTYLRAQGIYQSGGVPDSSMEQSQLLLNHSKHPSIQEATDCVNPVCITKATDCYVRNVLLIPDDNCYGDGKSVSRCMEYQLFTMLHVRIRITEIVV